MLVHVHAHAHARARAHECIPSRGACRRPSRRRTGGSCGGTSGAPSARPPSSWPRPRVPALPASSSPSAALRRAPRLQARVALLGSPWSDHAPRCHRQHLRQAWQAVAAGPAAAAGAGARFQTPGRRQTASSQTVERPPLLAAGAGLLRVAPEGQTTVPAVLPLVRPAALLAACRAPVAASVACLAYAAFAAAHRTHHGAAAAPRAHRAHPQGHLQKRSRHHHRRRHRPCPVVRSLAACPEGACPSAVRNLYGWVVAPSAARPSWAAVARPCCLAACCPADCREKRGSCPPAPRLRAAAWLSAEQLLQIQGWHR